MNPLTNIRNQEKLNQRELDLGISGSGKSWHQKYSNSAWIYVGGLNYELNEGDMLAVFSQYGEIVNVNLVRDRKTGKSRGFGFICYEDQRSTVLAVDNFNGIKLSKRIIRVDHVEEYKVPKFREEVDPETLKIWEEGCAPKPIIVSPECGNGRYISTIRSPTFLNDTFWRPYCREKIVVIAVRVPTLVLEGTSNEEPDPAVALKRSKKVDEEGVLELDEEIREQVKKEEKKARKAAKKEKKRLKKEQKLSAMGTVDDSGMSDKDTWKSKRKLIEKGVADVDDLYNKNEHFNFGKPKKELPPPPTHNLRPDFEKADWREIEIYKTVKEKERQEKGEKSSSWKEEEHYLPKRFHHE